MRKVSYKLCAMISLSRKPLSLPSLWAASELPPPRFLDVVGPLPTCFLTTSRTKTTSLNPKFGPMEVKFQRQSDTTWQKWRSATLRKSDRQRAMTPFGCASSSLAPQHLKS